MWPDQVSNPGPLTYVSGALQTELCGPASQREGERRDITRVPDKRRFWDFCNFSVKTYIVTPH